VTTGDVSGAGTDARIFITVFGTKGITSPLELENTDDRFQRARTDLIRVSIWFCLSLSHVNFINFFFFLLALSLSG
jgi:hypothetical protein